LSLAATMRPPVTGGPFSQVVMNATGAGDDRHQRDDVVGFEAGLDDEIDMARASMQLGIAIAAGSVRAPARSTVPKRRGRRRSSGAAVV